MKSESWSEIIEQGRPTVGLMYLAKISITPSVSIAAVQEIM